MSLPKKLIITLSIKVDYISTVTLSRELSSILARELLPYAPSLFVLKSPSTTGAMVCGGSKTTNLLLLSHVVVLSRGLLDVVIAFK